jgi:zinc D-Ala-D-Ala carboxypeptidase
VFRTSVLRLLTAAVLGAAALLAPVALASPAHADGCFTWTSTLRENASGEAVTRLQIRIAGWMTTGEVLAIDGKFGAATTRALKRFQAAYGLAPDGVAGPATFSKIYELQDNDCTPIHFSFAEVTPNCGRGGFSGGPLPAAEVKENLLRVMWKAEALRHKLGDNPMHVNSGFRDTACNNASNGASNSEHLYGRAIDFSAGASSLCQIARTAETTGFNGIFGPGYPAHDTHTHVDSGSRHAWSASRCGI